jgi:hypothetical protein
MQVTFDNQWLHHSGKCVVALRTYVPNEQAWVCDFLARVAKLKLLWAAMTRIHLGIPLFIAHLYYVHAFFGSGPLDGLEKRKGRRYSQRPSHIICMAQNTYGYPLITPGLVSRQRQGPRCNKWGEALVELVLYQVNCSAPITLRWPQTLYRPWFYLSLIVGVNVTNMD